MAVAEKLGGGALVDDMLGEDEKKTGDEEDVRAPALSCDPDFGARRRRRASAPA